MCGKGVEFKSLADGRFRTSWQLVVTLTRISTHHRWWSITCLFIWITYYGFLLRNFITNFICFSTQCLQSKALHGTPRSCDYLQTFQFNYVTSGF